VFLAIVFVIGCVIMERAGRVREWLSTYHKAEDMINIGAYVKGSNPKIDISLKKIEAVNNFLIQRSEERVTVEAALNAVEDLTRDS
jgi:flagellum-specific ATP synthase